jgi:hypothetical protein
MKKNYSCEFFPTQNEFWIYLSPLIQIEKNSGCESENQLSMFDENRGKNISCKCPNERIVAWDFLVEFFFMDLLYMEPRFRG